MSKTSKLKQPVCSAPSLDQLLSILSVTRSEIVAVARRSKAGRMGERDMDIIPAAWTKLKQKKWQHLQAEYFALVNEGAQQAIAEVNPMAHNVRVSESGGEQPKA